MSLTSAIDLNLFEPATAGTTTSTAVFNVNPYINSYIQQPSSSIINYSAFFNLPTTTLYSSVLNINEVKSLLDRPLVSYSNGAHFPKLYTSGANYNQTNPLMNEVYLQLSYDNQQWIDANAIMVNINNISNKFPTITNNQYNNIETVKYMGFLLKSICDVSSKNIILAAQIGSVTQLDLAMKEIKDNISDLPNRMSIINTSVLKIASDIIKKNNFNATAMIDILSDFNIYNQTTFTTPFYYNLRKACYNSIHFTSPSKTIDVKEALAKKLLIDLYLKAYCPLIHYNILEIFKTNLTEAGDFINSRFSLLAQVLLTFNMMNAMVNTYKITDSQNTLTNIFNMLNSFIDNYDGNDLRNVIENSKVASMNASEFSKMMDDFQTDVSASQIELKNIIALHKDIKGKYHRKIAEFWILISVFIALFISCSLILGFLTNGKIKDKMILLVYGISGTCAIVVVLYEFLTVLINFISNN